MGFRAVALNGTTGVFAHRDYQTTSRYRLGPYGVHPRMLENVVLPHLDWKQKRPDLMVVDGGKGQLQVALTALADLGVKDVEAVAMAKMRVTASPRGAEIERSEERLFLPNRSNPVVLRRNSNALFLLQRIRDEAHRFAITYHRSIRKRETLRSGLDGIPGVGPSRRKALLRRFGSMKRLRDASLEQLLEVPSMSRPVAERIIESFQAAE